MAVPDAGMPGGSRPTTSKSATMALTGAFAAAPPPSRHHSGVSEGGRPPSVLGSRPASTAVAASAVNTGPIRVSDASPAPRPPPSGGSMRPPSIRGNSVSSARPNVFADVPVSRSAGGSRAASRRATPTERRNSAREDSPILRSGTLQMGTAMRGGSAVSQRTAREAAPPQTTGTQILAPVDRLALDQTALSVDVGADRMSETQSRGGEELPGEHVPPPPPRRTLRRMFEDPSHYKQHEFLHSLEQQPPAWHPTGSTRQTLFHNGFYRRTVTGMYDDRLAFEAGREKRSQERYEPRLANLTELTKHHFMRHDPPFKATGKRWLPGGVSSIIIAGPESIEPAWPDFNGRRMNLLRTEGRLQPPTESVQSLLSTGLGYDLPTAQ